MAQELQDLEAKDLDLAVLPDGHLVASQADQVRRARKNGTRFFMENGWVYFHKMGPQPKMIGPK